MKTLLSLTLIFSLASLANADDKAAPVGTWKCEYSIGDQKRTSELTIKKDGDKVTGTMSWPDQKDEKLKDVKWTDGKLTFSAVRKFQGNEIAIDYSFKVGDYKLTGKGEADFGGQKQSFDIEAKRDKK